MAKQQPAREKSTRTWETGIVEQTGARQQAREAGRIREVHNTGANRPAHCSTARDVTSINPRAREPVDPASPFLIPA
ncbi:MAG: hypothetical protein J2P31_07570 [Blastocatellia bacterium]|nr:hypothetical protein [Blastocatellia bacterium]